MATQQSRNSPLENEFLALLCAAESTEQECAEALRNNETELRRIGSELARHRGRLGLSGRAMAKQLNVSAPFLGDMERGNRTYNLRHIRRAIEVLAAAAKRPAGGRKS